MLLPDAVMGACADDRLCWLGISALEVLVVGAGALLFWPSAGRSMPDKTKSRPGRRFSSRAVNWRVWLVGLALWIGVAFWLWWRRQ